MKNTLNILMCTTWGEEDSNLRSRKTTDLQSAPVGHFGISPQFNHIKELPLKTDLKRP
jgi:hypothetical protein